MTEAPAPTEAPVQSSAPSRPWRLPGRGALAVADQIVVSGTSFATSVIVARTWAPEDFGLYSLALSLTLMARAVLAELVCSPYTVYSGRFRGDDLRAYTGSALVHYLVLTAVAVAALFVLAGALGWGMPAGTQTAVAVAAAVAPFLLVREFARRVDLSRLQVEAVFVVDAAIGAVQIGGLLLLKEFHVLTVGRAFAVVGASAAAGCVAWFVVRRGTVRVVPERIGADWRHNWGFARWSVVGFLAGSATPFVLPFVVAAAVGEVATGVFVACVTLINVAGTYITGVANYLAPRAARAFAHGGVEELRRVLAAAGALFSVTLGGFCAVVIAAGDWPATQVYGPAYAGCGPVLAVLAIQVWVTSLGVSAGNGLWAMDRPRANAAADACAVVTTLLAVAVLLPTQGMIGAAVGALIGTTAGALVRIFVLVRSMAEQQPKPSRVGGE